MTVIFPSSLYFWHAPYNIKFMCKKIPPKTWTCFPMLPIHVHPERGTLVLAPMKP